MMSIPYRSPAELAAMPSMHGALVIDPMVVVAPVVGSMV
jgi:hypothetical protein